VDHFEVTVQGKTYPICSVYMSVAESGALVPPDIFPVVPPNDINFPDLLTTPWYLAPGNSSSEGAKAFAEALIATADWQDNGESDWLLNPNTSGNPNDSSMESAYFLWRDANGQFDKGEFRLSQEGECIGVVDPDLQPARPRQPLLVLGRGCSHRS